MIKISQEVADILAESMAKGLTRDRIALLKEGYTVEDLRPDPNLKEKENENENPAN